MQSHNSSMRMPHGSGPPDGGTIHLPLNTMIQSTSRAPASMIMHSRLTNVTSELEERNLKRILFHGCDVPLSPITRSQLGMLYVSCTGLVLTTIAQPSKKLFSMLVSALGPTK